MALSVIIIYCTLGILRFIASAWPSIPGSADVLIELLINGHLANCNHLKFPYKNKTTDLSRFVFSFQGSIPETLDPEDPTNDVMGVIFPDIIQLPPEP